ncbi:MAG: GFA family protein [Deltaproteobacteria bacterium]|nr:GFA family protein [Deltaproteobacteria bacterium]
MTEYQGSCHCNAVHFSVEIDDLDEVISCNCSLCKRAGWKLAFVPATAFSLLSGAEKLTDSQFAKKRMHHTFCSVCGVRPFTEGPERDGNKSYAINTLCLKGLDVTELKEKSFDGASL